MKFEIISWSIVSWSLMLGYFNNNDDYRSSETQRKKSYGLKYSDLDPETVPTLNRKWYQTDIQFISMLKEPEEE